MSYENQWNISYNNKDNYLFYPHEEVIRFVSKYISKKTGKDDFEIQKQNEKAKVLDVGCGIGRHVKFLSDYKLDGYGIDFSRVAIEEAKKITELDDKLKVASVEKIPFENDFFDFALSHGVFDSMPFEIAKIGMIELHRCMKNGSLFYVDLISGDDSNHFPEYRNEEIVNNKHEQGTIQSYYNWMKINELLQDKWSILEAFKIKRESLVSQGFSSRYHLVLKRI